MQRGTRDAFRTSHVVFRSCRGEKPICTRDGTPSTEGTDDARRAFVERGWMARPRCRSPRRNDLCASLEAFPSYAAPHHAADQVFSGSADRLRGVDGSGFPTSNAFYRRPENTCRPFFPCKRTQGGEGLTQRQGQQWIAPSVTVVNGSGQVESCRLMQYPRARMHATQRGIPPRVSMSDNVESLACNASPNVASHARVVSPKVDGFKLHDSNSPARVASHRT